MALSARKSTLVLGETLALLAVVLPFAHLRLLMPALADPAAFRDFPLGIAIARSLLVVVTCQVTFFFNDLYEWRIIRSKHQSSIRLLESCSYALILLALIYFALDGIDRLWLGLDPTDPARLGVYRLSIVPAIAVIVLSFVTAYGYRRAFDWTLLRVPIADRLLMIGDGEMAGLIEKELRERHDPGYEIVGYILPDHVGGPTQRNGRHVFGGYEAIVDTVKAQGIDRVIVCLPERRGNLPVLQLERRVLRKIEAVLSCLGTEPEPILSAVVVELGPRLAGGNEVAPRGPPALMVTAGALVSTVTLTPAPGVSIWPTRSVARVRILTLPV